MYDNSCKLLIEAYPADFAAWLLGKPVTLAELKPTEFVSEPIRADSLLLQGDDVVLHVEFQTQPDSTMPRRMADYFLRIHKKFPDKQIKQVVIYLRSSRLPIVRETQFQAQGMTHRFEVVRLWEQPKSVFWNVPGLLPLAILSEAAKPDTVDFLKQIKRRIAEIATDEGMRGNLEAATAMFAGLKLEADVIEQVMRSQAMQESTFYQAIARQVEEQNREKWEQKGYVRLLRKIVPFLQSCGFPIEPILKLAGVTLEELQLQDEENSEVAEQDQS